MSGTIADRGRSMDQKPSSRVFTMDRMPADRAADYDRDFCAWATAQAALLRQGKLAEADVEHIAEEIEDLGISNRLSLASHLRTVIEHLMKLQASTAVEPRRGWYDTVLRARDDIQDLLEASPSLERELPDVINRQTDRARRRVAMSLATHGEDAAALPGLAYDVAQVLGPWMPD